MKFFIKVANSKAGTRYHALCVERFGIEKAVSFDIEAILLVSGLTIGELYGLPIGKHNIKT